MKKCPLCNSNSVMRFLDRGSLPLVNTPDSSEENLPLELYHCSKCSNVFSNTPKSPVEIFSDYSYLSSVSSDWLRYCRKLAAKAAGDLDLTSDSRIVEIASNDGYMLSNFIDMGCSNVLGIEPSANAARIARSKGIPVLNEFFNEDTALVVSKEEKADLVIAFNVLAHVPDINAFLKGIAKILKSSGFAMIQFHYMPDMIEKRQFDVIYHEHFSYLCLTSAETAARESGLRIYNTIRTSSQGGSLLIYVTHDNSHCVENFPEDIGVEQLRVFEDNFPVKSHKPFIAFANAVEAAIAANRSFLMDLMYNDVRIAGYGAAAKAVLFANATSLASDIIPCIADLNEIKQGLYLPGTDIPIVAPDDMLSFDPEYIIIFPWNLKNEISMFLRNEKGYKGRFIVFDPEPVVF